MQQQKIAYTQIANSPFTVFSFVTAKFRRNKNCNLQNLIAKEKKLQQRYKQSIILQKSRNC